MIEKKSFKLYERHLEQQYLEQQSLKGLFLSCYDQQGYHFELKEPQKKQYLIHYFQKELNHYQNYEKQGFVLVCQYGSIQGHWYYFIRDLSNEKIDGLEDDYLKLIKPISQRIDQLWLPIVMALFVVVCILMVKLHYWPLFLLLVVCLGLGSYLFMLSKNIKNSMNK